MQLENLRKLRKSLGRTQNQMAGDLNMAEATYQNYELGRREANYETLVYMADYFDTTIDYILGRTDIRTPINDEAMSIVLKIKQLHRPRIIEGALQILAEIECMNK